MSAQQCFANLVCLQFEITFGVRHSFIRSPFYQASQGSIGGAIWHISVSPDQRYLAVGSEDGVLRLYSISDGAGVIQYKMSFQRQSSIEYAVPYIWILTLESHCHQCFL